MLGNDCPSLKDLNNFVVPYVANKWYRLGIQLFAEDAKQKLDSLRAEMRNMEDSCTEMFSEWLESDPKPSWKKVIVALQSRSVNSPNLAQDIDKKLQRVRN